VVEKLGGGVRSDLGCSIGSIKLVELWERCLKVLRGAVRLNFSGCGEIREIGILVEDSEVGDNERVFKGRE